MLKKLAGLSGSALLVALLGYFLTASPGADAARDGAGNYTLPVNSFSTPSAGTVISPTDATMTFADWAAAFTDSLSRTGKGGMQADLDMGAHNISNVVNINGAPPTAATRVINTTAPLAGGGNLSADRTISINTNGIDNTLLRQSGALSLVGRSANSTGNVADITATPGSSCVFLESASSVTCANIVTANIANNAVTLAKFQQIAALSMFGNCTNALANGAAVTGTANQVLRVNGAGTSCGFGAIDLSQAAAVTGVLQAASEPAHTGDVTNTVGSLALTIGGNKVTNSQLAQAADGTIKSNISGATANESDNTISAVLDKQFGTTQGSVVYRSGAIWASLPPGSSGQFLTTQGAGANPNWSSGGAGTGTVTSVTCNGTAITASGVCSVVGQVPGETSTGSASSGNVGEYISANVASGSAISLTNNTAANIASISLAAGDWDVQGTVYYTGGATTNVQYMVSSISTASGALDLGVGNFGLLVGFNSVPYSPTSGSAVGLSVVSPTVRKSLASTTTIYLVAQSGFGTSTTSAYGFIRARRVR